MPEIIRSPVSKVFERWEASMKPVVDSLSMEPSKKRERFETYARLLYMGSVLVSSDLEGDECATNISFQTECFAKGTKALSKVFDIDDISRKAMVDMGFRCTYQSLVENADSTIKRVVSRYSRVYTGQLLGE